MKKQGRQYQWKALGDAELVETALANWQTLNAILANLSRRQTAVLLAAELQGAKRDVLIKRIHQRLARMRANEELRSLNNVMKDGRCPPWLLEELHA